MGMKIVAWLTDAGTPRARVDVDARWPGSRTEPSDALVTMDDAHARIDAAVAAERERCAAAVDHILREGGGTWGDWLRAGCRPP